MRFIRNDQRQRNSDQKILILYMFTTHKILNHVQIDDSNLFYLFSSCEHYQNKRNSSFVSKLIFVY